MDTMMSMAAPPVLQGSSGYYSWQRQLRIYVNGANPMMWEEITGTAYFCEKCRNHILMLYLHGMYHKDELCVIGPDAQEELESYEERPCAGIIGSGKQRVLTEFIEISSIEVLQQNSPESVQA
ncbi:uncharacterized protein UBRO_20317 [Ustilago bromivora]|uniref:Uncharacterized protein n=1 Tax=Ustilago bromivora TaxID=307758 RepID=A0A1K0H1T7_9BASI|nr:uncharacterized protein UBRO_20317 [Ustilago bromivora]